MSSRTIPYVVTKKDALETAIERAKRAGDGFYIGVASESGEGPLDAVRNRERGGHHADKYAKESHGWSLSKVNYTRLLLDSSVCELEKELIEEYEDDELCLNKKQGQKECIAAERGVVYVRTYSSGNSSVARKQKKSGAAKGARKRSK